MSCITRPSCKVTAGVGSTGLRGWQYWDGGWQYRRGWQYWDGGWQYWDRGWQYWTQGVALLHTGILSQVFVTDWFVD